MEWTYYISSYYLLLLHCCAVPSDIAIIMNEYCTVLYNLWLLSTDYPSPPYYIINSVSTYLCSWAVKKVAYRLLTKRMYHSLLYHSTNTIYPRWSLHHGFMCSCLTTAEVEVPANHHTPQRIVHYMSLGTANSSWCNIMSSLPTNPPLMV